MPPNNRLPNYFSHEAINQKEYILGAKCEEEMLNFLETLREERIKLGFKRMPAKLKSEILGSI